METVSVAWGYLLYVSPVGITIFFKNDLIPCFNVVSQFYSASSNILKRTQAKPCWIPLSTPTWIPTPLMGQEVTEGHTRETLPSAFISSRVCFSYSLARL